jgi:hypothetical protein
VNRQPLGFLDWMTRQAVEYLKDPAAWLADGDIALSLDDTATTVRSSVWGSSMGPISVLPSQLPPVARFGPPAGTERLPLEEVI